ncbi:hypothetical protein ACSFC0_04030 [Serratia marcescens]|uniref:hypothetical protein n=1 Tax=Serratia marcescens TaxID=615 RepID=UPI003EDADA0C
MKKGIRLIGFFRAMLSRFKNDGGKMRKIRKARFEALSYARIPLVKNMSREIEWYSNENNATLGAILLDLIDDDYVCVILGRDEVGVFRWIDGEASISSLSKARRVLSTKMKEVAKLEQFPQGGKVRDKNEFFLPVVSKEKMPADYITLAESEFFSPAKELIQEIAYSFEDPDGNYIEQFQSSGFNPRLWELYLYALFHELDFTFNRSFNAPDYVIDKNEQRICVEAVTVNPSSNGFDEPEPKPEDEAVKEQLLNDYVPIKYGSPLFSKLQKKYWEKEHVAGLPLILAIHDYHTNDAMMWTRPGLELYLYGAKRDLESFDPVTGEYSSKIIKQHRWKGKEIPSGFFMQPDAENISAVIHCNQATIGKFLRMGYLAEFGRRDMDIHFSCEAIFGNRRPSQPLLLDVTHQDYEEYWGNSVVVYHNPNARNKLNPSLFKGVAQFFYDEGQFTVIKPNFFPLWGRTRYRNSEK